jgi:hypothetical protein
VDEGIVDIRQASRSLGSGKHSFVLGTVQPFVQAVHRHALVVERRPRRRVLERELRLLPSAKTAAQLECARAAPPASTIQ